MVVKPLPGGLQGFDVNQILNPSQAAMFKLSSYDFCIRYIPRTPSLIAGNITKEEIEVITNAGLALSLVMHCPLPGWLPDEALGHQYGQYGAAYCEQVGFPKGATVWLDLEEVLPTATPELIIQYANNWFSDIEDGGYSTGLYCGYGSGLTNEQLWELNTKNYWAAYNTNSSIPNRGYSILQHTVKTLKGIQFDPNTSQIDKMGGSPMFVFL